MSTRGDDQIIPLLSCIAESLAIIAGALGPDGMVDTALTFIGTQIRDSTHDLTHEVGMVGHNLSGIVEAVEKVTASREVTIKGPSK